MGRNVTMKYVMMILMSNLIIDASVQKEAAESTSIMPYEAGGKKILSNSFNQIPEMVSIVV